MVLLALPPAMDSPPGFCFCGRKTVESHEFWFCSVECARLDSLRSLGNPECHYRNVVRDAYVRAGALELRPRRTMSADHLRDGPSEQQGFANAPPHFLPPTNLPHQSNVTLTRRAAQDGNMAGFPTLSQVAGKVLTKKATAGGPLVAERHDRPRWEGFPNAPSRGHPAQRPGDRSFDQISLDAIPLPEHVPARSLRRVPPIAALLNFGRARKVKDDDAPEKVSGRTVNPVIPVRKESLPSHHQMSPPSAVPVQMSKALRRSASFAGWNAIPHSGPSNGQDPLMDIIEEMREELSTESFDPTSLFIQEEPY
jgi:hypothetical protein